MPLPLASWVLSNVSSAVVDKVRISLEASSACWFQHVKYSGYAVAIGCAMEVPEMIASMKRWFSLRFRDKEIEETRDDKKSWIIPLAALGLIIIVVGIMAETYFEGKVSDVETKLREHESEKLSAAEEDAANARQATATLENQTEGLKLAEAQARLELARLTAPVHTISVLRGVATPDLAQGLIQRVFLTGNTRIAAPHLPPMPKGGSLTWTLFIDQDSHGGHQYTILFAPLPNPILVLDPNTRSTFKYVTDDQGRTTDLGFPALNVPIPKSAK